MKKRTLADIENDFLEAFKGKEILVYIEHSDTISSFSIEETLPTYSKCDGYNEDGWCSITTHEYIVKCLLNQTYTLIGVV